MTGFKKGAFFSVTFGLVSKVFSFGSSLLLAFLFGSSIKADLYFYLLLLATLLNAWFYGINLHLVVPEFIHKYQQNKKQAIDFANFFIGIYVICTVILVCLTALFPAQILGIISDFNKQEISQGFLLLVLASLHFSLFFLANFLTNLCESFQLFKIYFLSPLMTLLPLIFLFFTRNIEAMFTGYICCEAIQIAVYFYLLKTRANWHLSFKKPIFTKKFKKDFWAMQPNNFVSMLLGYLPLWLISGMQAGLISALNYARMISDTPNDSLSFKINNVAKIKLNQEAALQNDEAVKETLLKTDRFLSFLLIPLCAFTSIFAKDIVQMLFMRGHFNIKDVENTAFFLQFLILTSPIIALNANFLSFLSAKQLVKETTLKYAAIAISFIFIFVFSIKILGPFSYPIITLLFYTSNLLCNVYLAKKFALHSSYGKHFCYISLLLLSSIFLAFIIKILGLYQGNIFIKIFVNGITFVSLQLLLFYKIGFLKNIREDLNV